MASELVRSHGLSLLVSCWSTAGLLLNVRHDLAGEETIGGLLRRSWAWISIMGDGENGVDWTLPPRFSLRLRTHCGLFAAEKSPSIVALCSFFTSASE